jgi:hypothetical protein
MSLLNMLSLAIQFVVIYIMVLTWKLHNISTCRRVLGTARFLSNLEVSNFASLSNSMFTKFSMF